MAKLSLYGHHNREIGPLPRFSRVETLGLTLT